jgi:hypothetical protein
VVKSAWPLIEAYCHSPEADSLRIVNQQLDILLRPINIPGSEGVYQQAMHSITKVIDVIFPDLNEGPFIDKAQNLFEGLLKEITDVRPFTLLLRYKANLRTVN